MIIDLGH